MKMCKIVFPSAGLNLERLYNWGAVEAKLHGGRLTGSLANGTFYITALGGVFEGVYQTNSNFIEINVTKKPMLIPCELIKSFLSNHIK